MHTDGSEWQGRVERGEKNKARDKAMFEEYAMSPKVSEDTRPMWSQKHGEHLTDGMWILS